MKTLERAAQAIEAGKLWRAKEILSGSLATQPFSPELYTAYGDLLLRMGDVREAGKFLFLAARDQKQHAEAVQLYLDHLKAADKNTFYSTFPARARFVKLADYPHSVAEELKRRGFGDVIRHPSAPRQPKTRKDQIINSTLTVLIVISLLLFGVGVVRLIGYGGQTLYEWIKG